MAFKIDVTAEPTEATIRAGDIGDVMQQCMNMCLQAYERTQDPSALLTASHYAYLAERYGN